MRGRRADPNCPECCGGYVTPTMDGNRPCSLCKTTEADLELLIEQDQGS